MKDGYEVCIVELVLSDTIGVQNFSLLRTRMSASTPQGAQGQKDALWYLELNL